MEDCITIIENGMCLSISTDLKNLIKCHWCDGDILKLPHSIENIKPFACAYLKHISTVYLPNAIKCIGRGAFCECISLEAIIFPNSKQEICIGNQAFWKCYSLEQINLPLNLTSIPEMCFEDCHNLQQLILSKGLKRIEKYSFKGCKNLSAIFIGQNVEYISPNAFDFTESLTSILVHKDNTKFKSLYGILFEGDIIYRIPEAYNCIVTTTKRTNMIIAEALNKCSAIGEGAFRNTNIQYLNIPRNINGIFYKAFECCFHLKEIHFQDGVNIKYLGWGTFANCISLKQVIIPNSVGIIGHHAFANCSDLQVVYIPASVWRIKNDAFEKCENLRAIIFVPSKGKIRHLEEGSQWIRTGANCRILVPSSEIDYFKRIFSDITNKISSHSIL